MKKLSYLIILGAIVTDCNCTHVKSSPMRFTITNGITMDVEITKSDLRTIVGKSTKSNMFNAIKNALARDIPGYLSKAE